MPHQNLARRAPRRLGLALAILLTIPVVVSVQGPSTAPVKPGATVRLDAAEAVRAAREVRDAATVTLADGLAIRVWATNKLVMNPLAIDMDETGAAYVGATQRSSQVLDTRQHPDWVPLLHRLKTTDDLRRFFREQMATSKSAQNTWIPDENRDGVHDWRDLLVTPERVYRIADTDGDGVADTSTLAFAGLNEDVASDMLGGVLYYRGDVYVTAAPNVWRLKDLDKDGRFETKQLISTGYSVHPSFSGHDLSALTEGPDGRIYWKVGEIGMNVVDKTGKRWAHPHTGAVLRSNPDGSDFEVFAYGVRNPQEIAFDDYGNLVSVDNDGDYPTETERVVYITEGSDTGWRSNWQYGKYTDPDNNRYNVWMDEGLSRPWFEGQASYILPPIAPYIAGPSGFGYNPGTALDERFKNHFFVTSFTGNSATARVMAFTLNPKGAGFALGENREIVRGVLTGGMRIGPDGAMYLTDWVTGWGPTGDGRVWRLDSVDGAKNPMRAQVATLLRSSFGARSVSGLTDLLRHDDQRVRRKAQFELVRRNERAALEAVANDRRHQLARIHAMWGLGQLLREGRATAAALVALFKDQDDEIRAQAAKMLGDARSAAATAALLPGLSPEEAPRVQFFAMQALGRIKAREAVSGIVHVLANRGSADPYLRQAGYTALASIGDRNALRALSTHPSSTVRLAAVVALRRLGDLGVSRFLKDADPLVVLEAARAVNDEGGMPAALPELASLTIAGATPNEAFARRVLNANLRLGGTIEAARVAEVAARNNIPEPLKIEAISILGIWARPSDLDRVDGFYLGPVQQRDGTTARNEVADLSGMLDAPATTAPVKLALIQAAAKIGATRTAARLLARVRADAAPEVRIAALQALQMLKVPEAVDAVNAAMADADAGVRRAAIAATPSMPMADAAKVALLVSVVAKPAVAEAQGALAALGAIKSPESSAALLKLAEGLGTAAVVPALQLDLLSAMRANGAPALGARLDQLKVGRNLENVATTFPSALREGGDAARGRQVAAEHPAAQCVRCHVTAGGTATVGPNLTGVGQRLSRDELLRSLLDPSARIAPGFGQVSVTLRNGQKVDGVLKEETTTTLSIETPQGVRSVSVADVATRSNATSAMPPMGPLLQPGEIRDVVEFLTTQ